MNLYILTLIHSSLFSPVVLEFVEPDLSSLQIPMFSNRPMSPEPTENKDKKDKDNLSDKQKPGELENGMFPQ